MKTPNFLMISISPQSIAGRLRSACPARLLLLLLLLALPATVQAQYTYTTNNGAITITGYTGPGGAVTIPSTINGLPVTSIGEQAFLDCPSLTSVTIGNSVTRIGGGAFAYCPSLTSVTIPNSVTSIGWDAFYGCTSLTSVTIPNNVTSIGPAFSGCTSLSAITVEALNSFYSSVDGVLFNQSQTTLIQYPGGKAGSYTIPNRVTSIGGYAFSGCTSLTSVTIGNSVTSIGNCAFSGSTSLTSVTIPNSVRSIGNYAFEGCTSLTGVYFKGNSPYFEGDNGWELFNATIYYLPGTTGWGSTFGGRPTVLWNPQVQTSGSSFGVRTNQFGFTIDWASGMVVVVEACTDLANPVWTPVGTNILTGGSSYFSDPQWTNFSTRIYRLRAP